MTATDQRLRDGIRMAMQMMKDRQARFEDGGNAEGEDTYGGQYKLGLADGHAKGIALLEECTGVSSSGLRIQPPDAHLREEGARWEQLAGWPPQVAGDPDELPVRGAS